jgi:hypothetical protein
MKLFICENPSSFHLVKRMTRRLMNVVCLSSCAVLILCAASASFAQSRRFPGNKEAEPYTRDLVQIDKVELLKLKRQGDLWNGEIEASKTVEGPEAQKIASLWRTQTFLPHSAICHMPGYALKFYAQEKLIVYATLCWECDNIRFQTPKLTRTQGFGGADKHGQQLLGVLRAAFPEKQ